MARGARDKATRQQRPGRRRPPRSAVTFQTSRFNFAIPVRDAVLLYNASSGAVVRLAGPDGGALAAALSGPPRSIDPSTLPDAVVAQLVEGGLLVLPAVDEVQVIRERYWNARRATPMTLTITTTMDCNLGCYYCYEERSTEALGAQDVAGIVALAEERLRASGRRTLHVDWYGGEPLLNQAMLEPASHALQALCARLGVTYGASVVSNGTAWPEDVAGFVAAHALRQVQISFDGLAAHHDKRRRYRKGRLPEAGPPSSFERAARVVDKLLDHVRVDVRLNLDSGNRGDLLPFIAFMRARGWFERPFPAVFQPARISAFSDRSAFLRERELAADDFEALREVARVAVGGAIAVEESEVPDGYPYPRTSVCGALADDSVVIGADRAFYRCGLQVGERHRRVGELGQPPRRRLRLPIVTDAAAAPDAAWWKAFDPTELPTCRRCSFLPICWAGCPKRHLDGDAHAIAEQGAYWRRNLARLVADGASEPLAAEVVFPAEAQFRDAPAAPCGG